MKLSKERKVEKVIYESARRRFYGHGRNNWSLYRIMPDYWFRDYSFRPIRKKK